MTKVGRIAERDKYKVLEKNAIEMLNDGIGIDKVAKYSSLPIEKVNCILKRNAREVGRSEGFNLAKLIIKHLKEYPSDLPEEIAEQYECEIEVVMQLITLLNL